MCIRDSLREGDGDAARASLATRIAEVRAGRAMAGDDETLVARVDETVADLEELERTTEQYSDAWAGKLAMESWNQTSRGKARRRSRFVDEGFPIGVPGGGAGAGGGAEVLLAQGDIVQVARRGNHDAVVNAANPMLVGGAGVAGALMAAGGPELVEACRAYVADHGPVPAGGAAATPGFGLCVSLVVHAVGPRYGVDVPSEELLAAAHRSAIKLADAHRCTSIAIPAISTGVFGYPVEEAAPIALRAIGDALTTATSVRRVTFVLFDDTTMHAFRSAAAGV